MEDLEAWIAGKLLDGVVQLAGMAVALLAGGAIARFFYIPQMRKMKEELAALREETATLKAAGGKPDAPEDSPVFPHEAIPPIRAKVGSSLIVAGKIEDVTDMGGKYYVWLRMAHGRTVSLWLGQEWTQSVGGLFIGETISARGTVTSIRDTHINLRDCEISPEEVQ